jgi:hypothetical protein
MAGVGREFRNANQIEGERIYTFTIHRRTDITRLMRIKFDPLSPMNPASASALNFNIHDIRHDGDRFWTRILASEVK